MTQTVVPVALNGVTGRMGYRQHLVRSILAIRDQGGVALPVPCASCIGPQGHQADKSSRGLGHKPAIPQ